MSTKVSASSVGKIAKAANPRYYFQGKVTNLVAGRGNIGITTETIFGQVHVVWNGFYAGEIKPLAGKPGAQEYWKSVEDEMLPIREALEAAGYIVSGSNHLIVSGRKVVEVF